ncbi:MAG: transposase [Micrococcaceae bacterium]|nr:transposase [Micrococcaceae bacterium]
MTLTTTTNDRSDTAQQPPIASLPVSVEQDTPPRAGRAARRTFTNEFKRAVVEEYDAAPKGTKGAVLRRERLYDSHVNEWRAAIEAGTLGTMKKKSGSRQRSAEQQRIAALEKQVAKLESESTRKDQVIADREAALEVLGKGVSFLEALSKKQTP